MYLRLIGDIWFSYFLIEKIKISYLREISIAFLVVIIVFIGTLLNFNPFKSIINWGSNISDSYNINVEMTDISDAEKLTLGDFAQKVFNVSYDDLKLHLRMYSLDKIDENTTIKDFCKLNKISPEQLYKSLKGTYSKNTDDEIIKFIDITSYSSYFGNKKSIL